VFLLAEKNNVAEIRPHRLYSLLPFSHCFQMSPTKLEQKEMNIDDYFTPSKFNIAPEKWWLEDYFPIGKVTFQGLC